MAAFYPASLATMLGQVHDGTPASHEMIIPQPHSQVRPLPTPRIHSSAHRPRPVSMPPTATADRDRQHRQPQKGRPATRVLGDYTLTKTLGAGSMGKVKLAVHNITDEKVPIPVSTISSPSNPLLPSWPSKSYPAYTHPRPYPMVQIPRQRPSLNRHQKTPPRRSAPSVKLLSRCSSTIRTSAACEK